jgi:hypothetical protein
MGGGSWCNGYGTPVKKGDEWEEVPDAMGMEPCEKEMLWA